MPLDNVKVLDQAPVCMTFRDMGNFSGPCSGAIS